MAAPDAAVEPLPRASPSVVGNGRPSKRSMTSISRSSWSRVERRPRAGAPRRAGRSARSTVAHGVASRCSCTPRWRSPVQTSGSERPSSACHSSGGRSSSATTMPTWLTGLLVTVWIATVGERAAAEQPDVAGRRGGDGVVEGEGRRRARAVTYAADAGPLEARRPGRRRGRRGDRRAYEQRRRLGVPAASSTPATRRRAPSPTRRRDAATTRSSRRSRRRLPSSAAAPKANILAPRTPAPNQVIGDRRIRGQLGARAGGRAPRAARRAALGP